MPIKVEFLTKVGDNIRVARKANKCTLEVLACLSGIHKNTLWKIEKGKTSFDLATLFKIAEALNMQIKDLL
jgi:transcriptional regulator with XRE-family HTH domain